MTNDTKGTPSFLSQFNPPIAHARLRTTSQLVPSKFCDYVGEVCFFRVEYGKAVMILTDYTEHPLLPFLEGDGRPSGQASIITTLWDEHCQTAQDINITVGDLLYLKNLRPKVDSDNKIELAMNGYRPGVQLYRPTDPVQKLQPNDPLVKALLIRKSQYELHLIEQNTELAQHNIRPRSQEHGGASSQPQPTQPTRSQSMAPPKSAQPNLIQPSPAKSATSSTFPASPSSRAPPPVKVSTIPIVPTGSTSDTTKTAPPAVARATPSPPQDIQPVPNVPLKREPTSPIAVKKEPIHQHSISVVPPSSSRSISNVAYRLSTPAPSSQLSTDTGNSPTTVLMNKVKQAIRNNHVEGLRYVKIRARVVGFEPEDLLDFSVALCTRCPYKYPLMSKQKLTPKCPGCSRDGVSKFEYSFQLKLLDELGQAFFVDVDNEHASTLIGTGAGNMLKNETLLKKVKDRLALIGVTAWDQDEKVVYFDCCVRQHIVRDSQEQSVGGGNKRSGSPVPTREAKRFKSSLETDESGPHESLSQQPTTLMILPGQTPPRLTWSLVFTEIN
ncbi:hypothetical protein EC991_004125 [Linnemannia zychae]|nr:hypothetical protein EC991_004125 [Linnemannia zychae]